MRVELPHVLRHRLLFALPREDRNRLVESSEIVQVYRGDTVHEPGQLIDYIYFPLSAVFSLFGITVEGESVELYQVGSEGIVGISNVFPTGDIYQHDMLRTDVQMPGTTLRIAAEDVIEAFHEPGPFHDGLRRYLDILFSNLVTEQPVTGIIPWNNGAPGGCSPCRTAPPQRKFRSRRKICQKFSVSDAKASTTSLERSAGSVSLSQPEGR